MAAFAAPLAPVIAPGAVAQTATFVAASFAYFGAQYDGFRRSPPKAVRPPGLSEMQQLVAAAIEGSKTLVASLPNPLGPPPVLQGLAAAAAWLWSYWNGRRSGSTVPERPTDAPEPNFRGGVLYNPGPGYTIQIVYANNFGSALNFTPPISLWAGPATLDSQSSGTWIWVFRSGGLKPIRLGTGPCGTYNAETWPAPCAFLTLLPVGGGESQTAVSSPTPDWYGTPLPAPPIIKPGDPAPSPEREREPMAPPPQPLPFAPPPVRDPEPVQQPTPQPPSKPGDLGIATQPVVPQLPEPWSPAPGTGPYQPAPFPPGDPLTNSGEVAPAPAPLIQPTPADAHFPVPGLEPVTGNGPEPTLVGIARELGRLEQKAARMMNNPWGEGPGAPSPDLLRQLAEALLPLLLTADGAGGYAINSPCNKDEEGQQLPDLVASWDASVGQLPAVRKRLDALAELLQYHKDLPQPTCKKPTPSGEWVTVNFEEI